MPPHEDNSRQPTPTALPVGAEHSLWEAKLARFETLGRSGSWEFDPSTRDVNWSDGTYRIFDVEPGLEITVDYALSFYDQDTRAEISRSLEQAGRSGKAYDLTVPFTSGTGRRGWLRTLGQLECGLGGWRIVGVVRDISEEHENAEKLLHLASVDPLTLLANRRTFEDRLATVIADPRSRSTFSLCLVDVDQFKCVNDAHGHAAGDRLLQEVARRLREVARPSDMVARLGGNEFAILATDLHDSHDLDLLANDVVEHVQVPLAIDTAFLTPTVSVGACFNGGGHGTAEASLRHADMALHKAKLQGKSQPHVLRPHDRSHTEMLTAVRQGLTRGEFQVLYQPIVDLRTRIVRGWEALIRWRHPEQGLLAPASFMAALLDARTSVAIDEFVLETGLRQMRQWIDAGVPVTCVGVNLSEAQLKRPDLVTLIMSLLDRYALSPDRLKVEVLETAFLGHMTEAVEQTIETLAGLGVVSALDDFGTGFASLTHLKRFRVERIKIDRSFVRDICSNAYDKAIVKSMIDLGRNLGIRVTAEGIETVEQLRLLRDFNCDCGQGYLFGRPMPADDVPLALARWYGGQAEQVIGRSLATERPTAGFHAEAGRPPPAV